MEQQIQIKADDNVLQGKYSNNMQVAHNAEEFTLDFFNIMPPSGSLVSRIITSPSHYKKIVEVMKTNLELYEKQFGEIGDKNTGSPTRSIGFKTE